MQARFQGPGLELDGAARGQVQRRPGLERPAGTANVVVSRDGQGLARADPGALLPPVRIGKVQEGFSGNGTLVKWRTGGKRERAAPRQAYRRHTQG